MLVGTLMVCAALAAVHVAAPYFTTWAVRDRRRASSFAGGVSVAYVFLHVLPDLSHAQDVLVVSPLGPFRAGAWLFALAGLVTYYGVDRYVQDRAASGRDAAGPWRFQLAAFALYNLQVGYLAVRLPEHDARGLALFGVAMALHLLLVDDGLVQRHAPNRFRATGRWVLAGAVVLGGALGLVVPLHPSRVAATFAFLAGGIVLNALAEELPHSHDSVFWAFFIGAALFAGVLSAI